MSLLAVEGVGRNFGGLQALDGVHLQVAAGERRGIIGPNGAGKTTLFNLISGSLFPTSGRIVFDGRDVTRTPLHRRVHLGISRTYQITTLFPRLTVLENTLLAVQALSPRRLSLLRPLGRHAALFWRARELMEQWNLLEHADSIVETLSYGEQRKLEVVLALAGAPRMVLLDEPAAGLAPGEIDNLVETIRALPAEVTVLIIEHDLEVAFAVAERITVLHRGAILVEADAETVRTDPKVAEIYLGRGDGGC